MSRSFPTACASFDAWPWQGARADGAVIVSKDKDFLDLAAVRGTPPLVSSWAWATPRRLPC